MSMVSYFDNINDESYEVEGGGEEMFNFNKKNSKRKFKVKEKVLNNNNEKNGDIKQQRFKI